MKTKSNIIVLSISILLVIIIALTIFMPPMEIKNSKNLDILPLFNAIFNALSFFALILAYIFIKKGNKKGHVLMIFTALFFTLLFLVSYLLYHFTHKPTPYGGTGYLKIVYLFILATHIILAATMLPVIMFTLKEAFSKNYEKHKKIAKWALPMWLYVSFTGVLVYLLNSPYY